MKPTIYLDIDETLIHQKYFRIEPEEYEFTEKPVARVNSYTIWVRPGAKEAIHKLTNAGFDVDVLTNGERLHQAEIMSTVFQFQGTVYSSRDENDGGFHPPRNGEWILVDNLPPNSIGIRDKIMLLGSTMGIHLKVKDWVPVRFSKLKDSQGLEQRPPETGNEIMSVIDQIIKNYSDTEDYNERLNQVLSPGRPPNEEANRDGPETRREQNERGNQILL